MRPKRNKTKLRTRMLRSLPITLVGTLIATTGFAGDMPSPEEMWLIIQKQQQEIEALKRQQAETNEAVEATAEAVMEASTGEQGWWDSTSLGGYGELHYEGGDKDQLDFHRFVLFVAHEFNDRIRLFTEFELEHALAGDDKPGEVELEQAYAEFDLTESATARTGIVLVPVGILNETHEPPTFYGVERNRVEKNIIPTTWWEGGAGLAYTTANGFRLDGLIHGGLDVGNDFKIRGGRQKVASSTLREPALTGRVRYTGMPGIELATTVQHQFDITQDDPGDTKTSATLVEAHADIARSVGDGITAGLRGLYAYWNLEGAAARALGRDEQYGWYIEPSLRFATESGDIGLFGRYSEDDNTAGGGGDSKHGEFTVGANYWPHPDVVLKLDYVFEEPPSGKEADDRLNLGFGFQF